MKLNWNFISKIFGASPLNRSIGYEIADEYLTFDLQGNPVMQYEVVFSGEMCIRDSTTHISAFFEFRTGIRLVQKHIISKGSLCQ